VRFGEVIHELKSPRTAVATDVFNVGADDQVAAIFDANEFLTLFELEQFVIVGDAGKLEAIDLFILAEQRLTRTAKNWIPINATNSGSTDCSTLGWGSTKTSRTTGSRRFVRRAGVQSEKALGSDYSQDEHENDGFFDGSQTNDSQLQLTILDVQRL
jgi:hypothetical protein